jgi:hypothetical protein
MDSRSVTNNGDRCAKAIRMVKQHMTPQLIAIVDAAEADSERLSRIGRRLRIKDQRPSGGALYPLHAGAAPPFAPFGGTFDISPQQNRQLVRNVRARKQAAGDARPPVASSTVEQRTLTSHCCSQKYLVLLALFAVSGGRCSGFCAADRGSNSL